MRKLEMRGKGCWGGRPPNTLYAVHSKSAGVVKIGCNNDMRSRLSRFRNAYAEDACLLVGVRLDDPLSHEVAIHNRLDGKHLRDWGREWYPCNHPEVMNIVAHRQMEAAGHEGWLETVIDSWPRK
jgi:hypothetical protein